jgi:DNA polymerase-1
MKLIFDIEANGFYENVTKIWCVTAFDLDESQWHIFIKDEELDQITDKVREEIYKWCKSSQIKIYPLKSLPNVFDKAKRLIAHNGVKYDVPVLNKILGTDYKWSKCIDTFIMSSIFNPDRMGGHSLRAWGERLGNFKMDFKDFSQFSLEMLKYNIQDVKVNIDVYEQLKKEMSSRYESQMGIKWEDALMLEHEVSDIIFDSEDLGFPVDKEWMEKVLAMIEKDIADIDDKLDEILPYRIIWHTEEMEQGEYNEFVYRAVQKANVQEWLDKFKSVSSTRYEKLPKPTMAWCKTNGSHTVGVQKWFGEDFYKVAGPFTKVTFEKVNLNSQNQAKEFLLLQGWEPLEFTEKGSPRICEQSLDRVAEKSPMLKLISKRFQLRHKKGIIKGDKEEKGLINLIRKDGRITPYNNTVGAVTARGRHKGVANLPNVESLYGPHIRKIFTSGDIEYNYMWSFKTNPRDKHGNYLLDEEGNKKVITVETSKPCLIGCDASGIELRLLAHFLDDEDFTNEILSGDIHSRFWGVNLKWLSSRGASKGVTYAFLYGAGKDKLGSLADKGRETVNEPEILSSGWTKVDDGLYNTSVREKRGEAPVNFLVAQNTYIGNQIIKGYLEGIPELGDLVNNLKTFAKNHKFIKGIDGRKMSCRATHSALNLLIQSTGAIVSKRSLVIAKELLKKERLPFNLVTWYHDEVQVLCEPKHRETYKRILIESIVKAGEYYGLKCPLDGQCQFGTSWLHTH